MLPNLPPEFAGKDAGNCEAQREKYWGELSVEEKIERLREIVKQQGRATENTANIAFETKRKFLAHGHAGDTVMIPADLRDTSEDSGNQRISRRHQSEGDDCYF